MYNIAFETGHLLNSMFHFSGVNAVMETCRDYGYFIAVIFGLSIVDVMGKVAYCEVKAK
ncbi:MAG: hypothetical protein WBN66_08240 [Smithella sp.]